MAPCVIVAVLIIFSIFISALAAADIDIVIVNSDDDGSDDDGGGLLTGKTVRITCNLHIAPRVL